MRMTQRKMPEGLGDKRPVGEQAGSIEYQERREEEIAMSSSTEGALRTLQDHGSHSCLQEPGAELGRQTAEVLV